MALNFPDSPVAGTVFGAWRYDGTKWGPVTGFSGSSAGDITAVLAGAGLTGGGTEGDVSVALSVPVTVARGGTGATDAAAALVNLGGAPLASPTFTGDPRAPTASPGDNDTSLATTAFVTAADNAVKTQLIGSASTGMDTLGEIENYILANINPALGNKADIFSPTFTGDPKAPTPAVGDNDTSIATTAFVKAQGYLVAPINLTSQVTGVLPVANGGTGASTAAAAPWVEVAGDTMTGPLVINQNAATLPAYTAQLRLGATDATSTDLAVDSFGTSVYSSVTLRSARGTAATRTAVQNTDALGVFRVNGAASASVYGLGGQIYWFARENWTGTANGTACQIVTIAPGTTTAEFPICIGRGVSIGGNVTNDPGPGNLHVLNGVTVANGSVNITVPSGTNAINATVAGSNNCQISLINGLRTWNTLNNSTGEYWIYDATAGAARLFIQTNGNCYNQTGTWNAISDRELKRDVCDYTKGLDAIRDLRPVTFKYNGKGGTRNDDSEQFGLIAQEVEDTLPEFVSFIDWKPLDEPDIEPIRYRGVDIGRLIYPCINAIRELSEKIERLEAEIAELKSPRRRH